MFRGDRAAHTHHKTGAGPLSIVRSEMAFIAGAITTVLFVVFGHAWLADLSSTLAADGGHGRGDLAPRSVGYHAVLLVLTMLPFVLLSKKLAQLVEHGTAAIGGVLVAILVLTPLWAWRRRALRSPTSCSARSTSVWAPRWRLSA